MNKWKIATIILAIILISITYYFIDFYYSSNENYHEITKQLIETDEKLSSTKTDLNSCEEEVLGTNSKYIKTDFELAECTTNNNDLSLKLSKYFIDWDKAKNNIGDYKIVCGPIANINLNGNPIFIDIGDSYPSFNRVSIVSWENTPPSVYAFLNIMKNLKICVMGEISDYNGTPQIIVYDWNQINF